MLLPVQATVFTEDRLSLLLVPRRGCCSGGGAGGAGGCREGALAADTPVSPAENPELSKVLPFKPAAGQKTVFSMLGLLPGST